MKAARLTYNWKGVSTSNLYMPELCPPLRLIQIPVDPSLEDYKTVINPVRVQVSEDRVIFVEGCGSLSDLVFYIFRPTYLEIAGIVLKDYLHGNKDPQIFSLSGLRASVADHEIDHIEARLLPDCGSLASFKTQRGAYPESLARLMNDVKTEIRLKPNYSIKQEGSGITETIKRDRLHLSLSADNSIHWILHHNKCSIIPDEKEIRISIPYSPEIISSLLWEYQLYQRTAKPGSFFSLPVKACDECLGKDPLSQ